MKYLLVFTYLLVIFNATIANDLKQVDSLCIVADQLYKRSAYDSSKAVYSEALELAEASQDSSRIAGIWNSLGLVAFYQNDFPTSMRYFLMHLNYAELHKDKMTYADALTNVGRVYLWQNNLEKSLEFFDRAIEASLKGDDQLVLSKAYQNKGVFFWKKGAKDSSLYYMRKSLAISKILDDKIAVARLTSNVGILYGELEMYDSAIVSHKSALEVFEEAGDKFSIGKASNNLANVYLLSGNTDLARPLIAKGLDIGQALKNYDIQKISYENWLSFYRLTEIPDSIFRVVDSLKFTAERLVNESSTRQIHELQAKYESDKKEQQIANLELEKRSEEIKRTTYAIGLLLSLTIGGFIIFGLRYRIRKNRQIQQKEELIVKQQFQQYEFQLKTYTDRLVDKSSRIEELNQELELVKKEISGKCPSYDGTIDHLMQSSILTDDEWLRYKKLFSQVHPGFFAALRKSHSDLTDADERLLALTKLNLQTKEIAAMLGISADSVHKSRYRLRKKLKIDPGDFEELVATL